jgi:hypothetical protein
MCALETAGSAAEKIGLFRVQVSQTAANQHLLFSRDPAACGRSNQRIHTISLVH